MKAYQLMTLVMALVLLATLLPTRVASVSPAHEAEHAAAAKQIECEGRCGKSCPEHLKGDVLKCIRYSQRCRARCARNP